MILGRIGQHTADDRGSTKCFCKFKAPNKISQIISYFCKISDPQDNPVREKSKKGEEREKYANNRGHYVLPATPKGEARTSLIIKKVSKKPRC